MLQTAEVLFILAGTLPLVAGYYSSNSFLVASGCAVIGLFWLLAGFRRWTWVASLGLFAFISAAGAGIWIGLSPFLMALSVFGSLFAWDLADFNRRLRFGAPEDDLRHLQRTHLLRLGGFGIISLILILFAFLVHLKISFGWMFLLTLAAVFGIMLGVSHLRQGG
jgi:hypothetical protein